MILKGFFDAKYPKKSLDDAPGRAVRFPPEHKMLCSRVYVFPHRLDYISAGVGFRKNTAIGVPFWFDN
jgi:hypothetical protein